MVSDQKPRAMRIDAPRQYRFPSDPSAFVSWEFVEEQLETARNYWLATTYPDGRPHVAPVWGLWLDNAPWFDGLPTTRWARNLAQNPSLCVHLESGEEVVILEGEVDDLVTGTATADRIRQGWHETYGRLEPQADTQGIFRLRPARVRAWSGSSPASGARWLLDRE